MTIVARGDALGYAFYLPEEERYLHTKEELVDWMIVALAGRAAEEVVFGRVTNGAANDLEKVTEHRPRDGLRVGHGGQRRRRARCAPTTTRSPRRRSGCATASRRGSPTPPTRRRCGCSQKHRAPLDRLASALLEKETLVREELMELFGDVEPESRASETVGMPRVVAAKRPTPGF